VSLAIKGGAQVGKIFTWPEVTHNQVPTLRDFDDTLGLIKAMVTGCQGVLGCLVLGSVVIGRHNRRSDLDLLYVYDVAREEEVRDCFQWICTQAADRCVPLDLIPVSNDVARQSPHHALGPGFIHHLQRSACNGGVIKDNPLEFITHLEICSPVEDAGSYIGNKLYKLSSGLMSVHVQDEMSQCEFLQKVVDAPLHIARRHLFSAGVGLEDDTKPTVLELYRNFAPAYLYELLLEVIGVDRRYSVELEEMLSGCDAPTYASLLDEVWALAPRVVEFARANLLML
jgi:hypothetical protein